MAEAVATVIVYVGLAWMGVGLVFALWFVARGVERVDPAAKGGTWGFRALILPGVAALWPVFALRVARGAGAPEERTAHRLAARERA